MKDTDKILQLKQPVELAGDFLITWDNYGYILSEKHVFEKGKNAGQVYSNNPTFHPNMEQLCEEYARRYGQKSESLEEMAENWKKAVKSIKKILEV